MIADTQKESLGIFRGLQRVSVPQTTEAFSAGLLGLESDHIDPA